MSKTSPTIEELLKLLKSYPAGDGRVKGPVLAKWEEKRRKLLGTVVAFCLLALPVHAQTYQTAFSPHQGGTSLITQTINSAHTTIHMAAYGFTSVPIINALCAAKARGVVVSVVVDRSQIKGKQPAAAKACGVQIKFNSKYAIMHDKFLVIDGNTVETGSMNYTSAGENKNAENVICIHDLGIATVYNEQWKKLWDESK